MKRGRGLALALALMLGATVPLSAAGADFEVTGPDGRRILLKGDGTWQYAEGEAKPPADRPVVKGEAVLTLERREDMGPHCRFGLRLANETDYEIRNIVPTFSAYRISGVLYDTIGVGFFSIKPGNNLYREVVFQGIRCDEIGRLQVGGGERCVMGDLDRFSYTGGACLERVRVVPSELVRFDK